MGVDGASAGAMVAPMISWVRRLWGGTSCACAVVSAETPIVEATVAAAAIATAAILEVMVDILLFV